MKRIVTFATCLTVLLSGFLPLLGSNAANPVKAGAGAGSGSSSEKVRVLCSYEADPTNVQYLKTVGYLQSSGGLSLDGTPSNISCSLSCVGGAAGSVSALWKVADTTQSRSGWFDIVNYQLVSSKKLPTDLTDWTGAEYVQLYVDNETNDSVSLHRFGSNQGNLTKTGSKYLLYSMTKPSQTWETKDFPANAHDWDAPLMIPSGFKGLVRLPLGSNLNSINYSNVTKFNFNIICNGSGNLYFDDIALVGASMNPLTDDTVKTAVRDVSESDYLNTLPEVAIRLLNTYQWSDADYAAYMKSEGWLTSDGQPSKDGNPNNVTLSLSDRNGSNDSSSLCWQVADTTASRNGWLDFVNWQNAPSKNITNGVKNWSGASYLQFYVNNQTDGNMSFKSFGSNWKTVAMQPGSAYELYSAANKIWTLNQFADDLSMTIPVGFQGLVRIPLGANLVNITSYGKIDKFNCNVSFSGNGAVYWDDFALVGNRLAPLNDSADQKAVKDQDESKYIGELEVKVPETEMNVRVLNSFGSDSNYAAFMKSCGFLGFTSGPIGHEISAKGGVSNSSAFKLTRNSDGYGSFFSFDLIYTKDSDGNAVTPPAVVTNWKGAKYLQIYIDNQSSGDQQLDRFKINGKEAFTRNAVYQTRAVTEDEWTSHPVTWIDDSASDAYIYISNGFTGLIRIPLSGNLAVGDFSNVTDLLMHFTKDGTGSGSFYFDDLAIVGDDFYPHEDDSYVKTYTEPDYWNIAKNAPVTPIINNVSSEKIRVLVDFNNTESFYKSCRMLNSDGSWHVWSDPADFVPSFSAFASVSGKSLQFYVPGDGNYCEPILFEGTGKDQLANWNGAEYLQFWVKNLCDQPANLIGVAPGGTDYPLDANITAQTRGNNGWVYLREVASNDTPSWEIPAYFEGLIRVKLTSNGLVDTLKLGFTGKKGAVLFLDDVSIVGRSLASAGSVKVQEESDYLQNLYGKLYNPGAASLKIRIPNPKYGMQTASEPSSSAASQKTTVTDTQVPTEQPSDDLTVTPPTSSASSGTSGGSTILTVGNLKQAIDASDSGHVVINVTSADVLTTEMQQMLQKAGKSLTIQILDGHGGYTAIWKFDTFTKAGGGIDLTMNDICEYQQSITKLLGEYKSAVLFSLKYRGTFDTPVQLIVPNTFGIRKDMKFAMLRYNPEKNKLELVKNSVSVTSDNKYIGLQLTQGGDYAFATFRISDTEAKQSLPVWGIVLIVAGAVAVAGSGTLVTLYFVKRRKTE